MQLSGTSGSLVVHKRNVGEVLVLHCMQRSVQAGSEELRVTCPSATDSNNFAGSHVGGTKDVARWRCGRIHAKCGFVGMCCTSRRHLPAEYCVNSATSLWVCSRLESS